MAKTVQLSEDAYASLAALKRRGESFSDVVNRLVRSQKNPLALLELSRPREDFDFEALRRASLERDLPNLARRGRSPAARQAKERPEEGE